MKTIITITIDKEPGVKASDVEVIAALDLTRRAIMLGMKGFAADERGVSMTVSEIDEIEEDNQ